MIDVRKLVKRFGLKSVLRGLDFHVEPGEFVALLGPNGAGKTTFLRILASLSRPSLGKVTIAGHALPDHAAEVRRRLRTGGDGDRQGGGPVDGRQGARHGDVHPAPGGGNRIEVCSCRVSRHVTSPP